MPLSHLTDAQLVAYARCERWRLLYERLARGCKRRGMTVAAAGNREAAREWADERDATVTTR